MINIPDISKNYRINLRIAAGEMGNFDDLKFRNHFEDAEEGRAALLEREISRQKYLAQRKEHYEKETAPYRKNILTEEEAEEQIALDDASPIKRYQTAEESRWKKLCWCCFCCRKKEGKAKKGGISFIKKIENALTKLAERIGFDVIEPDDDPEDDIYNANQVFFCLVATNLRVIRSEERVLPGALLCRIRWQLFTKPR